MKPFFRRQDRRTLNARYRRIMDRWISKWILNHFKFWTTFMDIKVNVKLFLNPNFEFWTNFMDSEQETDPLYSRLRTPPPWFRYYNLWIYNLHTRNILSYYRSGYYRRYYSPWIYNLHPMNILSYYWYK